MTKALSSNAIIDCSFSKVHLECALNNVTGIVKKADGDIPILGNVKLTFDAGSLKIHATDLTMHATESLPATVLIGHGREITVQAHVLRSIAKKLRADAEISAVFREGSNFLTLSSGRAKFELSILSADDFPQIDDHRFDTTFAMEAQDLFRLLKKTSFCMGREESRPYLSGVYFHAVNIDGSYRMRAVATDGHRLARVDGDFPDGAEFFKGVILPDRLVKELLKILADQDGEVKVSLSEAKVKIDHGSTTLISCLVEGSFPDYNLVIPKKTRCRATLSASDFLASVDLAGTVANEKTSAVKMTFYEDTATVSCTSPFIGSSMKDMDLVYSGSDRIEMGFNRKYLSDTLGMIEGDEVEILMNDNGQPPIFLDKGAGCEGDLYLIMPVRV